MWVEDKLVNAIGFQLVWWLSVAFGYQMLWLSILLLTCHVIFHSQSISECKLVIAIAIIGYGLDTILTLNNVLSFSHLNSHFYWHNYAIGEIFPPFWLLVIWLAFAMTIRQSLTVLPQNKLILAVLGAVFGASSYLMASLAIGVELPYGLLVTGMIYAVLWAIFLPFSFYLAEYFTVEPLIAYADDR